MTRKITISLCVVAMTALILATGCPPPSQLPEQITQLSEDTTFVAEITIDDQVVFKQAIEIHNLSEDEELIQGLAQESEDDPMWVALHLEPELDLHDLTAGRAFPTIDDVNQFISDVWPDGLAESFHQATLDWEINPAGIMDIFSGSGLDAAATLELLTQIEDFYLELDEAAEATLLIEWLDDIGATLADFQAAVEAAGVDMEPFLRHLNDLTLSPHILVDMFNAFDRRSDLSTLEDFDAFIQFLVDIGSKSKAEELLGLGLQDGGVQYGVGGDIIKAGADIAKEFGKLAWEAIVNCKSVVSGPTDEARFLNGADGNVFSYTQGTLDTSSFTYTVKDNSFTWLGIPAWTTVEVVYDVVVYYDSRHATLPGRYIQSFHVIPRITDLDFGYCVTAHVEAAPADQIGSPTNPIPQSIVEIRTTPKFALIPLDHHTQILTMYGDSYFRWGLQPRR